MNYFFMLLVCVSLLSCSDKKPAGENNPSVDTTNVSKGISKTNTIKPIDSSLLIVPGNRIGLTSLGQNAASLSVLGKPDLSDAAMGKAWMSWYSKKPASDGARTELMIMTGYKDSEMIDKVVKEIWVNSGDFKTENGIGTGTAFDLILAEFPDLKPTVKYTASATKKEIAIYDSVALGIGFEIETDNQKCVAIIVHPKGKVLSNEYLTLHPEQP